MSGPTARGSEPGRRLGQRHAAPYCVFTSTLERERWRENCLERAPSERKWTRCRRAHANTASNNGPTRRGSWQPTCISLRPRAPARQLGASGQVRRPRSCRSGKARSQRAAVPLGGVSPHFDVAMSRTFCGTPRAHAVFSPPAASRWRDMKAVRCRSSPVKFFLTKIPLPTAPTATERACGRRPCRVVNRACNLLHLIFRASNQPPAQVK